MEVTQEDSGGGGDAGQNEKSSKEEKWSNENKVKKSINKKIKRLKKTTVFTRGGERQLIAAKGFSKVVKNTEKKKPQVLTYTPDIYLRLVGNIHFPILIGEAKKGMIDRPNRKEHQKHLIYSMFTTLSFLPTSYAIYCDNRTASILRMKPQLDAQYENSRVVLQEAVFNYPDPPSSEGFSFSEDDIKSLAENHTNFIHGLVNILTDICSNYKSALLAALSLDEACSEAAQLAGFFPNPGYSQKLDKSDSRYTAVEQNFYNEDEIIEFSEKDTYPAGMIVNAKYSCRGEYYKLNYKAEKDFYSKYKFDDSCEYEYE